jgi:hypothetical protein
VSFWARVKSVLLRDDIVPGQANVEVWYSSAYSNGVVETARSVLWRRGARWHSCGELDVAAGAPGNTKVAMHVCVLTTMRGVSAFQAQFPYDLLAAPGDKTANRGRDLARFKSTRVAGVDEGRALSAA